ncbi:MAG: DUF2884 family protein [Rhodanobacter sp.]
MKAHHLACLLLLPAMLIGCDGHSDHNLGTRDSIDLDDGVAVIRVSGQPNAQITASGDLSIDDKPVTLTSAQQDLFKQYYAGTSKLHDAGIATGKAGAGIAAHALGSVVSGLAHGTPDNIGPEIQARAKAITDQVVLICDDLDQIRSTQDAIAGQLAVFRPYATLTVDKIAKCREGAKEASQSMAGAHQ